MRLLLSTRHRALLLCTGDDAREPADEPTLVAGAPAADLTQSPPLPWDERVEPYDDRIGFHA